MDRFEVQYSDESRHYLFDNWFVTEDLFDTIETLADTPDGLPDGDVSIVDIYYVWRINRHEVFYRLDGLVIRVTMIRPLE